MDDRTECTTNEGSYDEEPYLSECFTTTEDRSSDRTSRVNRTVRNRDHTKVNESKTGSDRNGYHR